MRILGLVGGMSWESTAHYYARINQLVAERLGGLHSAKMLLYSLDFDELQKLQHADDWAGRRACWWMPHNVWNGVVRKAWWYVPIPCTL